jgi:hypothetical protein
MYIGHLVPGGNIFLLYRLVPDGKNVLLIHYAPGGNNPINMRPLWGDLINDLTPSGSHVYWLFGPRHQHFFIVPFGP